jgi:predicted NBD/HSP70 family sugar kinase
VYVSGEVGIGTGVIVDGRPMLGYAGYAGEAGHTLINPDGRPCRCGATGCWETEAGESALRRKAGIRAGTDGIDVLLARAEAREPRTLQAIAEVGRWLGLGLGNLVNLFNPEVIVLGGLYQRLFHHFEPSLLEALPQQALRASRAQVVIAPSDLDPAAPLLGAAELVLSGVLLDPAGSVAASPEDDPPVAVRETM